jgi:hypothetical protein
MMLQCMNKRSRNEETFVRVTTELGNAFIGGSDTESIGCREEARMTDMLCVRLPTAVLSKIFACLALGDHCRLSRTSHLCAKVAKQEMSSPHTIVLSSSICGRVWPSFANFKPVQVVVPTNLFRHVQWWLDAICAMSRSLRILHFQVTPYEITDWTPIARALPNLVDFEAGGRLMSVVPLAHYLPHLTSLSAYIMRLTELVAFGNKLKSLAVEHWAHYDSDEHRARGWSALLACSNLTSLSLSHLVMPRAQLVRLAHFLPRLTELVCHSADDECEEEETCSEPAASIGNNMPLHKRAHRLLGALTTFSCVRIHPESSLLTCLSKLPHLGSLTLGDVTPIRARHLEVLAPATSLVRASLFVVGEPATLPALVKWLFMSPQLSTLELTWSYYIPPLTSLSHIVSLTSLTLSGIYDNRDTFDVTSRPWPTWSCLTALNVRHVDRAENHIASIPTIYPHLRELRLPTFSDADLSIETLHVLTRIGRLDMTGQPSGWFTGSKLVRLHALTQTLPHLHTLSLQRLSSTASINLKTMFQNQPKIKLNLQ